MEEKVLRLCESNFRHASATLHKVADEIAELEREGVECEVALVLRGQSVEVYAMGAADAGSAHILLACGQRKLENAILSHYEGR